MTKNTENIIKIDINSFVDMCQKIETLTAQNEQLKDENETLFETNELLIKEIRDIKAKCSELSRENQTLQLEIKDMKFTRKYLTAEDAGKSFARELLGKPMTETDIAEEEFIANGEAEYERTWNIACGDDF